MGVAKEMWMADYESVCEEFEMGVIGQDEFKQRMKALGFDVYEIEDHILNMEQAK